MKKQNMNHGCRLLSVVIMVCSAFTARVSAQVYKVVDLGTHGAVTSSAVAINDSGQIVGVFGSPGAPYRGFLWEDSMMIDLGTLGGTDAAANGINNNGEVVGYSHLPGDTIKHAFLWKDGVMLDLFSLGRNSSAEAIDDSGRVVGHALEPGDSTQRALLWHKGALTDLGALGGNYTAAFAINNSAQVAGGAYLADKNTLHAFFWENGSITDIGTLGGPVTFALDINSSGEVVGQSDVVGFGVRAFLWDDGVMTDLGVNGPATGINEITEVVGWGYHPASGQNHAFIWQSGERTDLNDLINPNSGWILDQAQDINNNGEIVGWGHHNLQAHAFLLKPVSIVLTEPTADELWISGDQDTIRWLSSLGKGESVILWYSLNDGDTWLLIDNNVPADAGEYAWTVPDTISRKARILITASSDAAKNDTSSSFRLRGYRLTKLLATGELIAYQSASDRWGFGNSNLDTWPEYWYTRFDYTGTDPFTGGSYLLGEPVTTEIFLNAQPIDHPDWLSFVRTFGVSACYRNTALPVYSPTAVLRWASIKRAWGGSCFGFATSNAIAFRNKEDFLSTYTDFPFYVHANEVVSDTNTIPVINELQTHQFGEPHQSEIASGFSRTPKQTLQELKGYLLTDDLPIRTLVIYANDGSGAHGILPYNVRRDPVNTNLSHIGVYDNSYPGVLNAEITVDTTANGGSGTWTYPLWPGWGGNRGIFLADPAVNYLQLPSMPKNVVGRGGSPFRLPGGYLNIHPSASAEVRLTDSLGRTTGYYDSLVYSEIPGSTPFMNITGSKSPPYGYRLLNTKTSVYLSEFADTVSRAFFFTGDQSFFYERLGATSAQTDRLWFDNGLSVVNRDLESKTVSLVNVVNFYLGEMVVSVRSLTLGEGDSVTIENVQDAGFPLSNGVKISSFGPASRTYDLGLEFDGSAGAKLFSHKLLQLDGASSHIIRPVWTTLSPGTLLNIFIDEGNNGSIDDTLQVDNEVTGIHGAGTGGRPTAFVLHQNYPNPFNPATVIRYEVPSTDHVTLKIYDVLGREVASLVDEILVPGAYAADWTAGDLPTGMYVYRLSAGAFTEMKKMILLR